MSRTKKILLTLAAMLAFVLVAAFFVEGLKTSLPDGWWSRPRYETVYHRPEPQPTVQTEPPETEPVETEPPETVPEETEPPVERFHYESVPRYDQTAYGHIRYQSGTMADSGSNIVSLAMAASYLTGNEYLPEELAAYFADFIGNSMQWLEYASDQLQLPWEKAANIDVTIQALREGKIAVVLMNERSVFMGSPHYVVFTGITEDGKILVNDPYGPHYDSWNLKSALEGGFKRGSLTGGYSGGWIYDPAAVPEQPFVYEMPANPHGFRYEEIELSEQDKDLIARLLCAEAESEPFDGQQAVAEVILNRMAAENFPNTANDVIFAEGQFLAANNLFLKDPTHTQYEAVERAFNGPYILDGDVVFFSQYAVNENIWGTIGKHIFCRQW